MSWSNKNKGPGANLRRQDLPPKRPSNSKRWGAQMFGHEWDVEAEKGRRKHQKYENSKDQIEHRGNGFFGWGKKS